MTLWMLISMIVQNPQINFHSGEDGLQFCSATSFVEEIQRQPSSNGIVQIGFIFECSDLQTKSSHVLQMIDTDFNRLSLGIAMRPEVFVRKL